MSVYKPNGLNFRNHMRFQVKKKPAAEVASAVKPLAHINRELAEVRESIKSMEEELQNGLDETCKEHYRRMIKQMDATRQFLLAQRAEWQKGDKAGSAA